MMYMTSLVPMLEVSEKVKVWVSPVVRTRVLDEEKVVAVVRVVSAVAAVT